MLEAAGAGIVASLQLHGTGTPLGDPIEAGAALTVLRPHDSDPLPDSETPPLVFCAAKSRIGHSEAAAGVMGLLSAQQSLSNAITHGKMTKSVMLDKSLSRLHRLLIF